MTSSHAWAQLVSRGFFASACGFGHVSSLCQRPRAPQEEQDEFFLAVFKRGSSRPCLPPAPRGAGGLLRPRELRASR
eukprot:8372772-Alexandrium_andersonii.AAC.1